MITLIPVMDKRDLDQMTSEHIQALNTFEAMFADRHMTNDFYATIAHAKDSEDNHYYGIEFFITSRWRDTLGGDLWVSGDTYRVNISNTVRLIREALNLVEE